MDNKQNQKIEQLFLLLAKTNIISIKYVSSSLNINLKNIDLYVAKLNDMGLDISIKTNKLHLRKTLSVYDIDYIKDNLLKSNIHTPIYYVFSTQSTNTLAKTHKGESIYFCDYQSKGKGRQEKYWLSPLGQSIAISISHKFNFGLNQLSGLNIAIGVAVINTFKHFNRHSFKLKWPNDVLGELGKVAGILIEASGNSQACKGIIGIGINWDLSKNHHKKIDQRSMNVGIRGVTRNDFIVCLIKEINLILIEFTRNKLKNLIHDWHQNDIFVNKIIDVNINQSSYTAKYLHVNNHGQLVIETKEGAQTIYSADISICKPVN